MSQKIHTKLNIIVQLHRDLLIINSIMTSFDKGMKLIVEEI